MSNRGHGSTGRRIVRRAAVMALYQFDALAEPDDMETIRASLGDSSRDDDDGDATGADEATEAEGDDAPRRGRGRRRSIDRDELLDEGFALAIQAWTDRDRADRLVQEVAPQWPTHRQAAVDRAILRLACWELLGKELAPGIVIDEAIELAREFSTEHSPKFVNGVLEAVRKRTAGETDATVPDAPDEAATPAAPAAPETDA